MLVIKNKLTGDFYNAQWRTDHACSSYNQPALVVIPEGYAVDPLFFEIVAEEPDYSKEKAFAKK